MKNILKCMIVLALAALMTGSRANAGTNDVWFGSGSATSGSPVDVFMSTDGSWFGLNLAFGYTPGVSGFSFDADSSFLTYIGGSASVAQNGIGTLADGVTGYAWETYPLIPDKGEWNGKIGTVSFVADAGDFISIYTKDGEWNGATAIFDTTNYGTWVGASSNSANSVKTIEVQDPTHAPVPEPSSLLMLSTGLLGVAGTALRRRFC